MLENPPQSLDVAMDDDFNESFQDDTKSLGTFKDQAKTLFQQKKYAEAHAVYLNDCLPLCHFKDQKATILTNMAMCHIKQYKFEAAFEDLQDALKFHTCENLDPGVMIKLKYRLAYVLSTHLRDYAQANSILKHLKKYCNTFGKLELFKEASGLYGKQSEYRNQRDHGKYKIKEIIESESGLNEMVADYVNEKVEIRIIEGKGRSFFAKSKIGRGELLIVNQAFIVQKDVGTSSLEKVVDTLDKKQRLNPFCTTLQLNYLQGGPNEGDLPPQNYKCYTGELTDYILTNQENKNFFLLSKAHLRKIVQRNIVRHDSPFMAKQCQEDGYDAYYLLFKSASFLNHSCKPNAFRSFYREDSSVMFVKAIRDIDEGEEITVSYVNSLFNYSQRQEALKQLYQFECKCERCLFEQEHAQYFNNFDILLERSQPNYLLVQNNPTILDFRDRVKSLIEGIDKAQEQSEEQWKDVKEPFLNAQLLTIYQQILMLMIELSTLFPRDTPDRKKEFDDTIHPLFSQLSSLLLSYLKLKLKNPDTITKSRSIGDQYSHLLFQAYWGIFGYKARYEHYEEHRQDEKLFYEWEEITKTIYAVDWDNGDGYLFQETIKRLYGKYSNKGGVIGPQMNSM